MKTAIYIEDGLAQLVLTPTTDFEKKALVSFRNRPLEVKIFTGAFYDCRGGWTKQVEQYRVLGAPDPGEQSIILRIKENDG